MDKLYKAMFYGCLIVIEYLATTTREIKVIEHSWDKANHFIAFMTLYILLSFAYRHLHRMPKALILLAFGLQIEIVQAFIPGRDFSGFDVVADSIGIGMGMVFYALYEKRRSTTKASS